MAPAKKIKQKPETQESTVSTKLDSEQIRRLALLLKQQLDHERQDRYQQISKTILCLAALGVTFPFAFIAPNTARVPAWLVRQIFEQEPEWKQWKKFNLRYLRQRIREMEKEKLIKLSINGHRLIMTPIERGIQKIFDLSIDELKIQKPRHWDGRWRLVIYDIPSKKKSLSELIQQTLKRLNFYRLQKSVYLFPYPCEEIIELLRNYYGLLENIKILTVERLEDDAAYREYFGL